MTEIIGILKGIRDLQESSAAKELMQQNPDYASNPDIIDKIGAVSPDTGNALRAQLPNAFKLREERAASGALWAQRTLGATMRAYQSALGRPTGELGSTEEGAPVEQNYAEADKAAQDMYGRYRSVMKQRGYAVDQLLPPVWNLRDHGRLEEEYGAITDAMRTPYNVVKPDGNAETMYFLPGEEAQFAAKMKAGGQPVRMEKQATAAPAKTEDARRLDANQRATITGKVGDDYEKASLTFKTVGGAFRNMRALENDPSPAGDLGIIYNYMKILDPTSVVREGEFATAQNAGSVPDAVRNLYNRAINGERISVNREDFVNQAERIYKEREREQDALDKGLLFAQRAYNLNEDEMAAIRTRVPRIDAAPRKEQPKVPTAATPDELGAALAVVRNPQAPVKDFTAALQKLPESELPLVNRKALTDEQLQAYVAELKARKARAKKPKPEAK